MDQHHRLQIANRIHLGLMRELGQGLDMKQMLGSALYARDVLLVCQAYPGTELQRLGEQFRQASAAPRKAPAAPPSGWHHDSSGFGVSKPAAAPTDTGFDSFADSALGSARASRRWLAPSSWFAR